MNIKITVFVCSLFLSVLALGREPLKFHVDFRSLGEQGEWQGEWELSPLMPRIPVVHKKILLPYGTDIENVSMRTYWISIRSHLSFELNPVPKPLCEDESIVLDDDYLAARHAQTPNEHLGDVTVQTKFGYRIAFITLYPISYDAKTQKSEIIRDAEIIIDLKAVPSSDLFRGASEDMGLVAELVDNKSMLESYPLTPTETPQRAAMEYLIIGPQTILEGAGAEITRFFLADKSRRGVTGGVHTIEAIKAEFTGRDEQEKIRNAAVAHYKNDGTRYVLLVGNGYSSLPTRMLVVSGIGRDNLPSDFYFACLDGDFDGNKNGKFGETKDGPNGGDVDLACEMAVGRAPASTLDEWRSFVMKALKVQSIESQDPRIWNALTFGEKLDGSTLGSKIVDKLITGGTAGGVKTMGYPSKTNFTKMYETFSSTFSESQVIERLSQGDFYTVNHIGHANESYCMRFMSSAIPKLTNTFPFFGITQGCHPGDLRKANWASKMVINPQGGAFAMVANSHYGFYDGNGSSDGPSNHYHLIFYDTVFRDGIKNLGKAHYRAKEKMIPEIKSSPFIRWVAYETNLLGDPELLLKF